jgi:hypothetical protein
MGHCAGGQDSLDEKARSRRRDTLGRTGHARAGGALAVTMARCMRFIAACHRDTGASVDGMQRDAGYAGKPSRLTCVVPHRATPATKKPDGMQAARKQCRPTALCIDARYPITTFDRNHEYAAPVCAVVTPSCLFIIFGIPTCPSTNPLAFAVLCVKAQATQ